MGALDGPVGGWIVANRPPSNRCASDNATRVRGALAQVAQGQVTEADWLAVKDFILFPTVAGFEFSGMGGGGGGGNCERAGRLVDIRFGGAVSEAEPHRA